MNTKRLIFIIFFMLWTAYFITAQTYTLTVRVTGLFEQSGSTAVVDMTMGDILALTPQDINGAGSIGFEDITRFQYQSGTVVSFMMAVPGQPTPDVSYAYNQFSHLEGEGIPMDGSLPDLIMDSDLDITAVYTYTVQPALTPSPLPPALLIGDVNFNGTVDIIDALMIAQYSVGLSPPGFDPTLADANTDGRVNIIDALVVAQYYVCLIDCSLPLGPASRVINPFAGATWYVNPTWSAQASANGGEAIAGYNTAIWLERIGAITAGLGVRGHLDEALSQGADLITFVINDFYDCTEQVSYGELFIRDSFMPAYKNEFIDPLAAIFSDPAYRGIRIVCILEPDALPSLVTNMHLPLCQEAAGDNGYIEGIQYALNRFGDVGNVYCYLDIGHSGWLGWDSNLGPMADLLAQTARGTTKGYGSVAGFISNTAHYIPLEEPFLPDPELVIGNQPIKSADFYEWNSYFDEKDFVQVMRTALIQRGFAATIGMLIDTSRNGWGGPQRPTAVSNSEDMNTYVDESRIDRRQHRGNWCNQSGGIGQRPAAGPQPGIAAYIWAYPPGESDGISYNGPVDPYDPALSFELMCDPDGMNTSNSAYGTDALDAPHRGHWNQVQFDILLQNAYPPL